MSCILLLSTRLEIHRARNQNNSVLSVQKNRQRAVCYETHGHVTMYIDVLFWFVFFSIFELILCRPKTDIPFFEACHGEACTWYADSRYTGCRPSDDFLLRFPYFDKSSTIDCLSVQHIFNIVEHANNMPSVFVGEAETQCVS